MKPVFVYIFVQKPVLQLLAEGKDNSSTGASTDQKQSRPEPTISEPEESQKVRTKATNQQNGQALTGEGRNEQNWLHIYTEQFVATWWDCDKRSCVSFLIKVYFLIWSEAFCSCTVVPLIGSTVHFRNFLHPKSYILIDTCVIGKSGCDKQDTKQNTTVLFLVISAATGTSTRCYFHRTQTWAWRDPPLLLFYLLVRPTTQDSYSTPSIIRGFKLNLFCDSCLKNKFSLYFSCISCRRVWLTRVTIKVNIWQLWILVTHILNWKLKFTNRDTIRVEFNCFRPCIDIDQINALMFPQQDRQFSFLP